MSLSELSIKKPVFAWMLMAGLIIFGALCFNRMGVSQLPDVDFPIVTVSVTLSGAAPEVMEVDVVDPIESALMGIAGIKSLSSSSKTGSANISVEFDIDKDIDTAVQEIQTVLSRITKKLPKDIDAPVVTKSNPEDQPILIMTVSSATMDKRDLMTLIRDRIQDRFTTVDGVGEVNMMGYLEPNLRVWLSTEKLNMKELTITDIVNAIQTEHTEQPSGRIEGTDKEFNIRTMGEAPTPEEFGKIVMAKRGGSVNYSPIMLRDVSTIEDSLEDSRRISRVSGAMAVGLGIKKQRGSNAVQVAQAVKVRIAELQKTLPPGVEIGVRFDTTQFIEDSIHELNFTLIFSAILTALVCWLFLGSFSATINVILAIPTSIIGSFICLYALGFTLNTFTLLGLSLAIGIVVDDAIMVLENIVRHQERGARRRHAALWGSKEITLAAMAATAAIIAIFLPVAFMSGVIGKFFFQFGVTISVAVLLSLLEALTLTPMRCSEFLEVGKRTTLIGRSVEFAFHKSAELYKEIIPTLLRFRWAVLIGALLIFISSFFFVRQLKKEFVPSQEQGRVMLRLQTKVGSSLEFTDSKIKEVENLISQNKDVEQYFTHAGGNDVNNGMIFMTLKPLKERTINPKTQEPFTQFEFSQLMREEVKKIKGIRVTIQDPSGMGLSSKRGFPVEFAIKGSDWDKLVEYSEAIMAEMHESDLFSDVDSDYKAGMPEVRVVPNRLKAKEYGVSVNDIATTINATMGGIVPGKFSKGGHRYDIRVRLLGTERSKPEDILKLKVRNNRGELIPLSKVVTIEKGLALQSISRQDRERAITVSANLPPKASQDKAIKKVQEIAKKHLPPDYRIAISGNSQTYQESFQGLIFALLLGIIVAYMVLASQFNSFIHPFTVLTALPFSITGAFIALYVAGQSLNIYSMIGIILLMGIVKKNSILLVDFTNQVREKGSNVAEALTEACPLRLRPILMTSIATIVGAIPAALALGPGAETRIPMAIAVIGGVFVSTLLTLFVVPCVYSILSSLERRKPEEID